MSPNLYKSDKHGQKNEQWLFLSGSFWATFEGWKLKAILPTDKSKTALSHMALTGRYNILSYYTFVFWYNAKSYEIKANL